MAAGDGLDACIEKMRAAGLAEVAIATFAGYYRMLEAGDTGLIPESEIEPVPELPDAADLTAEASSELLDQTVVIKLNGGLGTSMGMTKAKSLIEAKDGNTFLDLIARQVSDLRARSGARMPLVLMNSFSTQADSLAALATYPGVSADLPPDFLQGKEPKVRVDDLRPVEWPANPELEWCPPGHGDIYTALQSSGLLDAMLERGYRWAFVSNSDNLGATIDARILAWIAAEDAPFLMEVCDRTEADRKGGHIARWRAAGRRRLDAAGDGADARRGHRRAAGHQPPPLSQHEQPLDRPARPERRARSPRRRARAAADPQPQDRRSRPTRRAPRCSRSRRRWGRRSA